MSKILIILEEDLFLANVVAERIKKDGNDTVLVTNAAIGLEKIRAEKPDLLILDMALSTVNPFKFLEEKKKSADLSSVPTIIISPTGDVDEIRRVLDLDVRDYIVKSQFNADDLVMKIRNILSPTSRKNLGKNILEGKKVMWVEDDQFLSDLISRKLSQQKSHLLFANSGEEAIKVLAADQPDIILLDLLLPGISGFEVLEAIKKDDRLKNIPVIVLSNFTQNNEIEKTRQMGADRFLTKATVILDDIVKEMQDLLIEKAGR